MSKQMCHEICFKDVPNSWDSALPLGNGKMGAMVFWENHVLHIAINHYDCYYHELPGQYAFQKRTRPVETYEELCKKVDQVRTREEAERSHYVRTLHPLNGAIRPSYQGNSYPMGGELLLPIDERVDFHHSCLRLRIEEAIITFEAGNGEAHVTAEMWAAREADGILLQLTQSCEGLWKEAQLIIPPAAGMEPYHVEYTAGAGRLCVKTVYGGTEDNGAACFIQELALCHDTCNTDTAAASLGCINFGGAVDRITAVVSLKPGMGMALKQAESLMGEADAAKQVHQKYWDQYWTGRVCLPDAMLERLWYLQLYLLECSCGRGGVYQEQACGLSGLWDIRRPNMWGNMWYWDVNIQSSFWGCGCAGHPELLKVFCDAYLSYEQDIRAYTSQVYGRDGWALDYPHTLYHCIQPWCAQFLWQYYQYSGDMDFLEKKAYPVFLDQIAFFMQISEQDEQGIRHMRYDISPEQGPVTSDSVITVSCIRRLIRMALEAGVILNRAESEIKEMETILSELPRYSLTADGNRYRDSLLVQDEIFLRHPSMLMPLFPAEELDSDLDAEERRLWENTLSYAAGHIEVGTFGMGWLAAAAARLGKGETALRLIYEKGLDYILHTNGLAYEESERFLNCCHLTKPAHYLPVMMEFGGGLVNAVNQMVMQVGKAGEIKVFPAVPEKRETLLRKMVQYREDDQNVEETYGTWENVSFTGLMAPGGFRVSAVRKNGYTVYIKVESSREAQLRLILPAELSENGVSSLLIRQMGPGEEACWGLEKDAECGKTIVSMSDVLCHIAAGTHRRVFLGADRDTAYCRAVDAFTCAYLLANDYRYMATPYIFDFGSGEGEKDYDNAYPMQIAIGGQCALYSAVPRRIGAEEYCQNKGYGFRSGVCIHSQDRGRPDDIRRDFVEGSEEAVFAISLPKGKYDFLLICGDETEESMTNIEVLEHGTVVSTGQLTAGEFSCKTLPVVHERDGELSIRICTGEEHKWKLNAIFVNKEYSMA